MVDPVQTEVCRADAVAVGRLYTITLTVPAVVLLHRLLSVTVRLYVPEFETEEFKIVGL